MAYSKNSKKESNPGMASEFYYPDPSVKSSPASDVSLAQSKANGGKSVDPIAGPGVDNFTPVSSASDSPVRGDGYGDKDFSGRGDKPRSVVSYG